jgi:hypothetical protein
MQRFLHIMPEKTLPEEKSGLEKRPDQVVAMLVSGPESH